MYKEVELELTKKQQKDALSKPIQISGGALNSNKHKVYVHSDNYKKIMKAKKNNTGCRIQFTPGEIMKTAATHNMAGSGFFDDVWSGIKKAGQWLKDTGIATNIADALVPVASSVIGPTGATLARNIVKTTTGVGLVKKGSPEAKAKMEKLRAMKKSKLSGGSFRIN